MVTSVPPAGQGRSTRRLRLQAAQATRGKGSVRGENLLDLPIVHDECHKGHFIRMIDRGEAKRRAAPSGDAVAESAFSPELALTKGTTRSETSGTPLTSSISKA